MPNRFALLVCVAVMAATGCSKKKKTVRKPRSPRPKS